MDASAVGVVCFGNEAATISDELVLALKQRVDEISDQDGEISAGLKRGVGILIHNGPFDGYRAIFEACLSDNGRARVLLKVLKDDQFIMELNV